ncbi:hypothetical protein, partial [Rhodococcus sp. BS-15]|uniref:hypothetical protein n=1 Tax=Rhodococcus sp. BS-15 TaxID=1304954 RepID=UPI0011AE49FC
MRANTTASGMARYLTDPPESAQQVHQGQQAEANAERERPAPVTEIGSARVGISSEPGQLLAVRRTDLG